MLSSIRNRLLFILLTVVTAAWLLSAVTSYFEFKKEVEQLSDARLEQAARVILSVSEHEVREHSDSSNSFIPGIGDIFIDKKEFLGHPLKNKIAYQIWSLPDKLITRSASAPGESLSTQKKGYSDSLINDSWWRVYSIYDKEKIILVQVGERYELRRKLTNILAFEMMVPLFILLPTLAVFIWYGIEQAMRPMDRLAEQVSSRNPDHLDPITSINVPAEAAPLVHSMNTLFERLSYAFENERQFTSNAAHEMRTPLAGLKAQAQVALNAKDEDVTRKALTSLIEGVDRCSHLVSQMLILARLDPGVDNLEKEEMEISKVVSVVVEETAASAAEKAIDLALVCDEPLFVKGDKDSLAILVRNLADNAVRYTPRGGKVRISLEKEENQALLRVSDSGPGIPPSVHHRVFERFYRHEGVKETGSGLGLSIAGKIAALHDARVDLIKSDLGGLEVVLKIPLSM